MKDIIYGLSVAALVILIIYIFTIPLPIVQFSTSTGECVQVHPKGSCDNLPKKYVLEWTK